MKFSFIISIFLIFLQNARVHISGWVYRGDFGGLQLSHHLFLLHQNDKLPKFRQQHRGGMILFLYVLPSFVIASYLVFDSCTAWWMKLRCSVLSNTRSRSHCVFVKAKCFLSCLTVPFCIAELLKPMNVLSFIFSPCEHCFKHYYSRYWCSLSCWIH